MPVFRFEGLELDLATAWNTPEGAPRGTRHQAASGRSRDAMRDEVEQVCPKCGARRALVIVYGLPSPGLLKAAERKEVALGSCVISDRDPEWRCAACGAEWGAINRRG